MKMLYCWRCRREIPMLEDDEWSGFEPLLRDCITRAKLYREERGASIRETPLHVIYEPALDEYERITGFRETNPNALWHHRVSIYGVPCGHCGKPLRSPSAGRCMCCGASV